MLKRFNIFLFFIYYNIQAHFCPEFSGYILVIPIYKYLLMKCILMLRNVARNISKLTTLSNFFKVSKF